jgi:hypothetical protein
MKKSAVKFIVLFIFVVAIIAVGSYFYINRNGDLDENYTYKIENERLFVTYNYGKTWIEVPGSYERLLLAPDGQISDILKDGIYQISPEKTVFTFNNDFDSPPTIIYSNDKGKTWEDITLYSPDIKTQNTVILYVNFTSENEGNIVLETDYAMRDVAAVTLNTTDSGITWRKVNANEEGYITINVDSAIKFIDKNIGFISSPSKDFNTATLYKTEDGGKTYIEVILEPQDVDINTDMEPKWEDVYNYPQLPILSEDKLVLYVTQGEDGDYNGGQISAKYESIDMGKTWQYIEQVIPQ